MCALKREQARREWESVLQHVNSLQTLLQRYGEKVGHELKLWAHTFVAYSRGVVLVVSVGPPAAPVTTR